MHHIEFALSLGWKWVGVGLIMKKNLVFSLVSNFEAFFDFEAELLIIV